jgi:hypothetical protein
MSWSSKIIATGRCANARRTAGRLEVHERPRDRGPREQVHREHLAERDQVVVRVRAGEDRLLDAAEQDVDERAIAPASWEQPFATVVAVGVHVQIRGIDDTAFAQAGQRFRRQAQPLDEAVHRAQHRAGHVVQVDLVAAEDQRGGPRWQRPCVVDGRSGAAAEQAADQAVRLSEAVAPGKMRLAAGAVEHCSDA